MVEQLHKIRRAQPGDEAGLVELVTKGMPGYPFESVYDVNLMRASLIFPTDYRVVSIDVFGQIVGTAVLGNLGDYMQEIKRVVVDQVYAEMGLPRR